MEVVAIKAFFKKTSLRLIIIIISLLYVGVNLYWQSNNFISRDVKPSIFTLDQKAINRSSQVEVGLHISSFDSFSVQRNEFTLHGTVWFKFPVGVESLKTIEDFTIQNSALLDSGLTIFKSKPIIRIINNQVLVSYHVISTFKSNLNYRAFPLGDHTLYIQLQHLNVTPYELSYVSRAENLTFGNDLSNLLVDWRPTGKQVETGYKKADLESSEQAMQISYPTALFAINFKRIGYRDLVSLYFPMLVLFFISLFCLLLDVNDVSRLSYAATAIPILVLFRMVIDGVSPHVGYTTHLDYMYYVLVFLSLIIILFQTFVLLVFHRYKLQNQELPIATRNWLEMLNDIVFFVTLGLLVVLTTYAYFR